MELFGCLFGWWNRRPAGFLQTETEPLPYFSNCRDEKQTGGTPVPLQNQMAWNWLFVWLVEPASRRFSSNKNSYALSCLAVGQADDGRRTVAAVSAQLQR